MSSDDAWSGVAYVAVGLASAWVFASGRGPPDTGGLVAAGLAVVYGLATLATSAFSNPIAEASDRLAGCFWLAVGSGIATVVVSFPVRRPVSGLIVGVGVALYGLLVALSSIVEPD